MNKFLLPLVFAVLVIPLLGSQEAFAGGGLPPCEKTWIGGEGNWEDNSKWTPSPPISGVAEVICIDDGNIANSIVHLNSDFLAPLDIIVDSGDKLVVESGWTLTHGDLNFSYHNNGILQIFGSYVQSGSIFFNDGSIFVECGGSFEIFLGGLFSGPEPIYKECFIGGEIIPLDTTALLLAGMQTNFTILTALAVVGIGAFGTLYYTTKKRN